MALLCVVSTCGIETWIDRGLFLSQMKSLLQYNFFVRCGKVSCLEQPKWVVNRSFVVMFRAHRASKEYKYSSTLTFIEKSPLNIDSHILFNKHLPELEQSYSTAYIYKRDVERRRV